MNTIKMGQDRKAANARKAEKSEGTLRVQLARKIASTTDVVELTELAACGRPWVAKRAGNKLAKLARDEESRIAVLAAEKEANAETVAQATAKRSEAAKKAAATRKARAAAANGS